jgi:predicted RNA-binding Zn ribbon-like protein
MSQNSIKIINPFDAKEEENRGILLSFFSVSRDIIMKERKASYFNHFCFERLNKNERRWLLINLSNFINTLTVTKKGTNESHSDDKEVFLIPKELEILISTFKSR